MEEEKKSFYEDIEKLFTEEKLIHYIETFNQTLNQMKVASNPKILLEVCLVKMVSENNENKIEKKETINEIPKESKNDIKKEKQTNVRNDELEQKINELKKIRVNNTLSEFKKAYLVDVKEKIDFVRDYLFEEEYNEIVSLILDGTVKAASPSHIIFVFNQEWQSIKFNQEIIKIEELLNKIYEKKYNVIAVDMEEWNKIKEKFNSKKTTYTYMEEPKELINYFIKKEEKNEIEQAFSDIIEYE